MDVLIRDAIRGRRLIEFWLHGLRRVAEPHLYGRHKGVTQLLVYQVGGQSKSGGLPHWRRVDLHEVTGLRVMDETFVGPRPPSTPGTGWDEVFAVVE